MRQMTVEQRADGLSQLSVPTVFYLDVLPALIWYLWVIFSSSSSDCC